MSGLTVKHLRDFERLIRQSNIPDNAELRAEVRPDGTVTEISVRDRKGDKYAVVHLPYAEEGRCE